MPTTETTTATKTRLCTIELSLLDAARLQLAASSLRNLANETEAHNLGRAIAMRCDATELQLLGERLGRSWATGVNA